MGGLLTLALVALLALAFRSAEGRIVHLTAGALLLCAAAELARMGRFAELRLGWPIGIAALVEIGLCWAGPRFERGDWSALLFAALRPALLALAVDAAARLVRGPGAAQVPRRPPHRAAWIAVSALLVVLPLSALFEVWHGFGPRGLVALVALSKVGDIAGYYVGSAIGRRRPFPRISPGKTVAGCVASLIAGTVCGGAFVLSGLLPEPVLGLSGGLVAGALVNLGAQAGDLLESAAKRWAGVKDSGSWFGPSGGVLDLVDSLLCSVPVALLAWPLLFIEA